VQRLDNAHSRTPGQVSRLTAACFEADFLLSEFDRFHAGVDKHFILAGTAVVRPRSLGGGHAVDNEASIVSAGDGADHGLIVGDSGLAGQPVEARAIVEPAVDAAKLAIRS